MSSKQDQASVEDFRLLGLEQSASPQEVKKAYKSLVKIWHPDRFPLGSPQQQLAEGRLKDINAAYRRIRSSWSAQTFERKPEKRSSGKPPFNKPQTVGARPTASPLFESTLDLRQAAGRILTLLRLLVANARCKAKKTSRIWLPTLLVLSLMAILASTHLFLFWKDHWDQSQAKRYRAPHSVKSAPLPGTAPEGSESLENLSPKQTLLPSELRDEVVTPSEPEASRSGKPFFTIGSSQKEVLSIQGTPTKVHGQTWAYGLSHVTFKEGRVWRYYNFDGSLRVQMLPNVPSEKAYSPKSFSLGSTGDEVLAVQGTPTQVEPNKWSYGFSEVYFKNGVVSGYNNFFSNLKVLLLPSKRTEATSRKGYFTIGSSQDDVLAVQGTPTVVHGNTWSYQLSEVQFLDGKVRIANDFSGNLKYLSPDLVAER